MSGGGVGNVLSTGASLAAGQSPLGAFGGALGSQLLSGGGGGGSGAGAPAGGIGGIGRQNQTQLVGPMAGVNPASPAYNIMMQQQQPRPQVQQPQVGATLFNGTVTPNTIGPNGLPVGGPSAMPIPFNQWVQSQNQNPNVPALTMQQLQDKYKAEMTGLGGMGIGGVGQVPFRGGMGIGGVGQVQQALGVPGFGLSTAMQPYFQELAQQVSQPRPQVLPRPPVASPNPGLGLAGLANALQGQYK